MGFQLMRFRCPSTFSPRCLTYIAVAFVIRACLGRPEGFGYGGRAIPIKSTTRRLKALGRRSIRLANS